MSLDWLSNGSIWMEFVDRDESSEISAPFAFVLLRGLRMEGGVGSQLFATFDDGRWTLPGERPRYTRVLAFGVSSLHLEVQDGYEISFDCVNASLSGHVLRVDGGAIATLDRQTARWTRLSDGMPLGAIRMEPQQRRSEATIELSNTARSATMMAMPSVLMAPEEQALAA